MYKSEKISRKRFSLNLFMSALALVLALGSMQVKADVVTDWNGVAQQTILNAGSSPFVSSRSLAIVQASVFDAFNGIERRYQPIHVAPDALPGASRRAAVIQAAYTALLHLYPAQEAFLTAQRDASLEAITSKDAVENSVSIKRGIEWGEAVADEIFLWRSADGITPAPPPYP